MPQPDLSFCCRLISSGPANMELLFGPYICGSDGVSDHQTVSMNVGSEINCIWSQQQAASSRQCLLSCGGWKGKWSVTAVWGCPLPPNWLIAGDCKNLIWIPGTRSRCPHLQPVSSASALGGSKFHIDVQIYIKSVLEVSYYFKHGLSTTCTARSENALHVY